MKTKKKNIPLRILAAVLAVLLAVVLGYLAYVFIAYHRIPDMQPVAVQQGAQNTGAVVSGESYTAVTYNIGFGAYTPDYSFFMDGGVSSWAASKESVIACTEGAAATVKAIDPTFAFFEEMDISSTRSYHVDQKAMMDAQLPGYDSSHAINYDSPFLFYPFTQPHGKSYSGISLYSRFPMTSSLRRSFPITASLQKLIDLDRCYMVSRVPMEDGRELVLYTVHMTAYTSDLTVRPAQIAMLIEDMAAEYAAGNAVICAGDFNTEMISTYVDENTATWARPLERDKLGLFLNAWDVIPAEQRDAQAKTCRDAGVPYTPGVTDEWTVDGFFISPNVIVEELQTIDTGYLYSDHNPVMMRFHID